MRSTESAVNLVVYNSIPLNVKFKKYWLRKFRRMCQSSGRLEAERKFKHLKEVILRYRSDYDRHQHLADYLKDSGFRTNSFLRSMFVYADCQPHYLLDFIKLYSYAPKQKNIPQWGRPNSPHTLAKAVHDRLESIDVDDSIPLQLWDWIWVLCLSSRHRDELYYDLVTAHWLDARTCNPDLDWNSPTGLRFAGYSFRYFACHHSFEDWHKYWVGIIAILRNFWTSEVGSVQDKGLLPEVYKDYEISNGSSVQFDLDYGCISTMCMVNSMNGGGPLRKDQLEFILEFLSDEIANNLRQVLAGDDSAWCALIPELCQPRTGYTRYKPDWLEGQYVGHIHHIPKKGAGSDYRDIAVPNRFIQEALMPLWQRLRRFQECCPQDASLDQSRFDRKIQNRVNNRSLYVGTVDLSKATDHFPRKWTTALIDVLVQKWGWKSSEEERSYDLFKTVSSSLWEDQGYLSQWKVGQPLGSLPSFAFFTIGHWALLESTALWCGLAHHPYALVGDDLVAFNKKLRARYINTLTLHRIPLSLHKSYTGALAEFAGKTYVANCVPFFTTDHALLTWNSLFDYQVATGVRIPFKELPLKLRKKWKQKCKVYDPAGYTSNQGELTYSLAQAMLVPDRGSSRSSKTIDGEIADWFEYYMYKTDYAKEHSSPGPTWFHGIVNLAGHPVRVLSPRFADKDGWFERYSPILLPEWYEKYRSTSTDTALNASCFAVSDHKDSLADNTYIEPYGKTW